MPSDDVDIGTQAISPAIRAADLKLDCTSQKHLSTDEQTIDHCGETGRLTFRIDLERLREQLFELVNFFPGYESLHVLERRDYQHEVIYTE